MITITQFRKIKGFEDYEIDNDGNVYSHITNKILKNNLLSNGYYHVTLYKEGKTYHKQVHRLVAIAFLPNPHNLPQVNHKDENPKNNHIELTLDSEGNIVVDYEKSNLEWCTAKYNINYGTGNERRAVKMRGFKHTEETKRKLSEINRGKKVSEETRRKLSESHKGYEVSEETRRKLSESLKGIPKSEEHKAKLSKAVVAVDNDNNVVYEFPSTREAQRQGFNSGSVSACCRNCYTKQNINYYKGYEWYFKSDWLEMQKEKATPVKKELPYQLSLQFD